MIKVTLQGAKKVTKALKKADAFVEKSLNTAVRVEAFKLTKLIQANIRSGSPGGNRFAALSFIARKIDKRSPNRKALTRLAFGVKYHVKKQNPFIVEVGFPEGNRISNSFRKLAMILQKGFTQPISKKQRGFIVGKGGSLGTIEGGETPFFLKKTTRTFVTPERQIISPFWQAQQAKTQINIRNNFHKKLKGLRI